MVIDGDGYQAVIEYLIENIEILQSGYLEAGEQTIEEICMSRISEDVMAICKQQPNIDENSHFKIMQEVDVIFADLANVLERIWEKYPNQAQKTFLEEYLMLIKNLFDSALQE